MSNIADLEERKRRLELERDVARLEAQHKTTSAVKRWWPAVLFGVIGLFFAAVGALNLLYGKDETASTYGLLVIGLVSAGAAAYLLTRK